MNRLDRLERLRYEDPERAAAEAEQALAEVADSELSRCLGILASALRASGRLREAREVLEGAIAREEDWGERARLHQRMAYVLENEGRLEGAKRQVATAMLFHHYAADLDGVGQTLVDRGRLLYYQGRFPEAIAAYSASIRYLSEDSYRHRYSATLAAGFACAELGRIAEARRCLATASPLAEKVERSLAVRVLGLEGEIAEAEGDFATAEVKFRQAADALFDYSATDAAVASLRAVAVLLVQGKREEAASYTLDLAKYLEACRKNRVISGVLVALIRVRHSLELSAVRQAARKIRDAARKEDRAVKRKNKL